MEYDIIQEKTISNHRVVIKLENDIVDFLIDPREDDNLGTMALFHKRMVLGDKVDIGVEEAKQIEANDKDYISLPVFAYEHGIITISTSPFHCPWDSGQLGIIYVSKKDVRKEFGKKKISKKFAQWIEGLLKEEVELYDKFIKGEVYRFEIYNSKDEIVDSCTGFIGDDFEENGLMETIKGSVNELENA